MANQCGFTVHRTKNDKTLYLNGTKLVSTMEGTNKFGTYIKNNKLYIDGIPLVESTTDNATINSNTGSFGDVDLDTLSKSCINITLENYNKLLANELLPGYKVYDRNEVYNIVDNVENAPTISYTEEEDGYRFGNILWREKLNVVYNNVIGLTVSNPSQYVLNYNANMVNVDRPYINVRYFNPVVNYNSANTAANVIPLKLRIADQYNSILNYDTIGPRYKDGQLVEDGIYKLIIETEDGDSIEKYCYNGIICIDTPPFVLNTNEDRETWFTIQCIDSRGVVSAKQYLDVYIRAEGYQENFLRAKDSDLSYYGIDYNNSSIVTGYKNKLGFTNLFKDAKDRGYNGIVLPKHDYYLDYHANLGTNPEPPDPGPTSEDTFRFLHFSDVHTCGDSIIKCKELMTQDADINFSIFTGDLPITGTAAAYLASDAHAAFAEFHSEDSINQGLDNKLLMLAGNHDAYDIWSGGNVANVHSSMWKVNAYLKSMVTNSNVQWADSVLANFDKSWDNFPSKNPGIRSGNWYIDYPIGKNSKLRVVSVDQYELGAEEFDGYQYNNPDKDFFRGSPPYDSMITQKQVTWFINTIKDLGPNDYFIVACHTPPVTNDKTTTPAGQDNTCVQNRNANSFCGSQLTGWSSSYFNGDLWGMIINAYIHNDTDGVISNETVYNLHDVEGHPDSSVVVNADFRGIEHGTFLGYLCGHIHADICNYHPHYPDQLIMCIDCGRQVANNSQTDIYDPTKGKSSSDSRHGDGTLINQVDLDFKNKVIKITRIGQGSGEEEYLPTINKDSNGNYITRNEIEFPFPNSSVSLRAASSSINLGEQKYYYAKVNSNGQIESYESISLEEIEVDAKGIFRFPNNTNYADVNALGNTILEDGKPPIVYIGGDIWYDETKLSTESKAYLESNYMYLRTFKLDKDISYYLDNNINLITAKELTHHIPSVVAGRELYFVYNTAISNAYSFYEDPKFELYKDGRNLLFPDHFTVDMNGSKFIASLTYDVDDGNLVRFFGNIDSHLRNGTLIGLYTRYKTPTEDYFLKAHLALSHDTVGEHMSVFAMMRSKYCSIDNMDISGSLGYDCCVYTGGHAISTSGTTSSGESEDQRPSFINNTYVNENGESVTDNNVDMVSSSRFIVLKHPDRDLAFGRDGNNGYVYCGRRPEIFISFYDKNKSFIETIITKLYYAVKPPTGAAYMKFTGFGTKKSEGDDTLLASNWCTSHSVMGRVGAMQPTFSVGCEFKNSYLHDCRTVAFGNPQGHQLLYDNLTFERCATNKYLGVSAGGLITPVLCDFEDSWQWSKYVTMRDCTYIRNTDPTISSSGQIIAYNCEHFDFINNKGFSLKQGGGIESGILADSELRQWQILRTRSCFHPQMEYRDNIVKTTYVVTKLYDTTDTIVDISEEDQDSSTFIEIDTAYNDTIEPVISFSNCIFKNPINYGYFKLRKCKVDTIKVDYFY